MSIEAVLANQKPWACVESDAVAFLDSLPDDSVDLLMTSPPYELARTYGIGEKMVGGQAWVDWMVSVVRAASSKIKGLIAINCEGQTRGYRYSCVPFLLIADLHRAGFNLRKPAVFHRVGIPGSGGPDWLRNDYEPVVCVTRPGRLPWSDSVACGHSPKYGPGGALSYRTPDGRRVNGTKKELREHGVQVGGRSSRKQDGARVYRAYVPPDKSNPGNVLSIKVGGGKLGCAIAHKNEAPFPVEIAAFFVKSFCPPGGVTCDPFSGSGTTCHAAVENGRRFVGCDLRQSQVELCSKRMKSVTPSMFADDEPP